MSAPKTKPSVRKIPLMTIARRPFEKFMTVEFRTSGLWYPSTFFSGFYEGSRPVLRKLILARLKSLHLDGHSQFARLAYRIATQTKNRYDVVKVTYTPEIKLS